MNARLILSATFAVSLLAGCAQHREYVWVKGGATSKDLDLDLKTARAEAMKAYPSTAKLKNAPKNPHKAEEHLGEMRRSVQALYMSAHGWHLVYYDRKGRQHSAEHEGH